jgi:hypothetical protein
MFELHAKLWCDGKAGQDKAPLKANTHQFRTTHSIAIHLRMAAVI